MTKIRILRFSSSRVYNLDILKGRFGNDYDENVKLLINQKDSGRLKSWTVYFNDGEFEFNQFISDSEILHKLWLNKLNLPYTSDFDTCVLQIKIENPQIVFIHDYTFFNVQRVILLKSLFPKIKWITYFGIVQEIKKYNWEYFKLFDLVMVPVESMMKPFIIRNINVGLMSFGLIPKESHDSASFDGRKSELLFAGSVSINLGGKGLGHYDRIFILGNIAKQYSSLDIYSNKIEISFQNRSKLIRNLKNYWLLYRSNYYPYVSRIIKEPVFGPDYFNLMEQYKVVLNPQSAILGNIRFVETTFCENVTLTNYTIEKKGELDKIFGAGNYIGFKNFKELQNQLFLLKRGEFNLNEMAINSRKNAEKYYRYDDMFFELKIKLRMIL
jgi:hypothetical protein